MDGHVAPRAALVMRIDHAVRRVVGISDAAVGPGAEIAVAGVALQTELRHRWPGQQFGICGAVRFVAGDTTVFLAGLVFEHERSALLHMALDAGLIVAVRLIQHF